MARGSLLLTVIWLVCGVVAGAGDLAVLYFCVGGRVKIKPGSPDGSLKPV
jgi:hypothetical protein